jgi:glycine/D-amino acid oxidase-like deaminating enzyme/nitrite reductase/ring-hydroxylating ferredoxin subunit
MPGSGATRSAWMDGVSLIPGDGPLPGDAQADVCIVGAGVAGLTTAYLLAREGHSVLVIDDGPPGMGETLRTTAHLTAAIDDRIHVIAERFGAKKARIAVQSQVAAIDRIERICQDERLDGIFRRVDGYLFLAEDDTLDNLRREMEAAHDAGLADVRMEARAPLPFDTGPALVFPRQGEVDAGEYVAGLADAIRRMGGRIHGSTHATGLDEGEPLAVRTPQGRIECEHAVVCTDSPVFGKVPMHTKQEQYRTYVAAWEVPRGFVPRALYWDTRETGYHYVRFADRAEPGNELLIVGGEDHRTGDGDPQESLRRLEDWVRVRFGLGEPVHRWSGQVVEPADHLPFQGRYPGKGRNVYVITGDSGQGFTNHTAGAILVTDLIEGRKNPWASLYRPNRQAIRALVEYVRANVEGGAEAAKDKAKAEAVDETEIAAGTGGIVERDGKLLACYREPSGDLRECSAQCTHLGATVRWNDLEKTWDCPWHGSRFTATGQVVNGPANRALDGAPEALAAAEAAAGRARPARKPRARGRAPKAAAAGRPARARRQAADEWMPERGAGRGASGGGPDRQPHGKH